MSACRLCGASLTGAPRLVIDPAPAGAQRFAPTVEGARARAIALEIVECIACGLVQSASPPVEGYRRAITAAGVSGAMREHRKTQALRLKAQLGASGARLALIGCGSGYELAILAEAGFDPVGIESGGAPSSYDENWPIFDGYPERGTALPGAPFQAFACYNFLEHAADPRGFLSSIAASLVPGASGVVEVPNYAKQRTDGRVADYVADHLSYFDANTLRVALLISGLDVVSLGEVRGGENLEAIVRVRPASPLAGERAGLDRAQQAVHGFFVKWSATGTPAVAWGASHQALTLLAGGAGETAPRAIIDAAPFKQGQFAPPTGIPIVAPTREALVNTGAVLVIASGYESEIVQTLRSTLAFDGEVWAMRGQDLLRLA